MANEEERYTELAMSSISTKDPSSSVQGSSTTRVRQSPSGLTPNCVSHRCLLITVIVLTVLVVIDTGISCFLLFDKMSSLSKYTFKIKSLLFINSLRQYSLLRIDTENIFFNIYIYIYIYMYARTQSNVYSLAEITPVQFFTYMFIVFCEFKYIYIYIYIFLSFHFRLWLIMINKI